jgi:glycosyltransferase involved in cell wall biosynthesis
MIRHIFIIVPSASMASPIKGAAALANALSREQSVKVTFISLKKETGGFSLLNEQIEKISLSLFVFLPSRLIELRRLIRLAGDRGPVAAISFCFSADVFNSWCGDLTTTCSSVRGNLSKVYPETYGWLGKWVEFYHFSRLNKLDTVVSMTRAMSDVVAKKIGKKSPIIGNFIDEPTLVQFRHMDVVKGPLRFVYTGSMIRGKQPELLLRAIQVLQARGIDVSLDAYGDGPLLSNLREQAKTSIHPEQISFHGYVEKPYAFIAVCDVLVLPSLTEGVSRSVLEALFLGIPCVLRDVDGGAEIIKEGLNGGVFHNDNELADVMLRTAEWSRRENPTHNSLLPEQFVQKNAATKYLELLNGK